MGWLRDLMQSAGVRSYGALARAALSHQCWPTGVKAQQRSLATMLSRFDRGLELDWLGDRPAVQQVFAELLGCTVADLRAPMVRDVESAQTTNRFRFDALPMARSLELLEEALPPGIPSNLAVPSTWQLVLWLARPGDGATLVGQWLDARGRAEVRKVRDAQTLETLPIIGPPLYVRAVDPKRLDPNRWRPVRPACLCADIPESNLRSWSDAGWLIVRSPPLDSVLEQIVAWVEPRISPKLKFDAAATSHWLRDCLARQAMLETLEDVLGWCGHIAETGLDGVQRRTGKQALVAILKRILEPLARGREATTAWVKKAPDLIIAMAERSLLIPDLDLIAPRPLEAWIELLPEEERVGPDLDWMKTHLAAASKTIRTKDLERAAAQFPPGAHRWLAFLRDAGLLRPVSADDYALRPHYLARLSRHIANAALLQGSSAVWGTTLFRPRPGCITWQQLKREAEVSPDSLIDSVLEELDEESPGCVLALEATVIAMGLALLAGNEIPTPACEQLLDEACALALQNADGSPSLRLGLGEVDGVDSNTMWWLSLVSLSETASRTRTGRPPCLDPWGQREPPAAITHLLDRFYTQVVRLDSQRPTWVRGAFLTFDRLRQILGTVTVEVGQAHPALLPGIALDEVQHGVLEWTTLEPLVENELLFEIFVAMAEHRRVTVSVWASALWQALSQGRFAGSSRKFLDSHIELLSPYVPASLAATWLDGTEPVPSDAVLTKIPEKIISNWLDQRDIDGPPLPSAVVECAGEGILDRMLADLDTREESLLPIFWRRVPHQVVTRIHRFRVMLPAKAARWIDLAPVAQSSAMFKAAALDDWLKASEPLLLALRRFCTRCIESRSDDWQLAYGWLARIERVLKS